MYSPAKICAVPFAMSFGIYQGMIEAVSNIGMPILASLILASPKLILSKIKTTSKHNCRFLIRSVASCDQNNKKIENKWMYSMFGIQNHNLRSSFCHNNFGCNANLGTFPTIDVYFFFLY